MLSGISQKNNMRSGSCRFTEFCNSQCLSHFAAPFNTARAETFIAESCEYFIRKQWTVSKRMHQMVAPVAQVSRDQPVRRHRARAREGMPDQQSSRGASQKASHGCRDICANDPSAGSPTETLLRLLPRPKRFTSN